MKMHVAYLVVHVWSCKRVFDRIELTVSGESFSSAPTLPRPVCRHETLQSRTSVSVSGSFVVLTGLVQLAGLVS